MKNKISLLNKDKRYQQCPIPVIAITGGIACGKSTFCDLLVKNGYKVLRADELVKKVYSLKKVKDKINKDYPEFITDNKIEFKNLRASFFSQPEIKKYFETLVYENLPNVFNEELEKINHISFLFYEIPLLFELNLKNKFDYVICVHVDRETQIERLKARDYGKKNTSEIEKILDSQMDLDKKINDSHFSINNNSEHSLKNAFLELKPILKKFES